MRWTPAGRTAEEIQKIKDFSSFQKNPPTRDPRTEKQIKAYRDKERGRAQFLASYRQWERYKETLGRKVPSFQTFMKHKFSNRDKETGKFLGDEKYHDWERLYRQTNRENREAQDD